MWLYVFFYRHYKQAYMHTLELRTHDTNLLEIKTIAGFINYKVSSMSSCIEAMNKEMAEFCVILLASSAVIYG